MLNLKKWILNNIDIKILAIIMALILWFYITSEYNTVIEKYYDIEVRPINLSNTLSIKEIRDQVSVGIQGPQNIIENISSQKLIGTVNLATLRESGEYQVPANVIIPKSTEIIKIIPNQIRVVIEEIISREYPVEYNLIGLPERGYSLKSEPVIHPKTIQITGPDSVLSQIGHVKVDIDISSINEDISIEEKVVVYHTDNSVLDDLKIQPENVSVTIHVREGYPEKELAVKPRIIGKPAPGYFVSKIEAIPNHLNVYGDYFKIENIEFLETIPIDVTGISKTLTVKIPPVLTEGLYIMENQDALIEVEIQVEESIEEKILEEVPILIREASPFLEFALNPETVNLTVSGKYSLIKEIEKEDIVVYVNLSDTESEKLKVELELPSGIQLIQVSPDEVNIFLKK